MTIRAAVVDDHPVFRIGMAALLDSLDGIEVVGQAASAADARTLLVGPHATGVDVVLMDVDLQDGSGVDVTREVTAASPGCAVLMVSMHEEDDVVVSAIRAGARGFLVKSASPEQVERAVRAVAAGEMILSPAVADRAMAYVLGGRTAARLPFPQLTDREREVLDHLAAGHDTAAIARRLSLSDKTIRNTVGTVLAKLGARDRTAAVVMARAEGLGGAGEPPRGAGAHPHG